jgi:hypothetical protein
MSYFLLFPREYSEYFEKNCPSIWLTRIVHRVLTLFHNSFSIMVLRNKLRFCLMITVWGEKLPRRKAAGQKGPPGIFEQYGEDLFDRKRCGGAKGPPKTKLV